MTFFLRTTLLSILVSLSLLNGFAQTPSVQWVREADGYKNISYYTTLTGYESKLTGLFALTNDIGTFYSTPILYKFGVHGEIIWQKPLSICNPTKYCEQYDIKGTYDGGLLLITSHVLYEGSITKYNQSGNTEWSIATDRLLPLTTSVARNNNFFTITDMYEQQVSYYTKTGQLLWSMTLENRIKKLQATDDNGVIALTSSGMVKLSDSGQIQWQNNAIEEQIKLINANYFCTKSTTSISMFSLINGNRVWSYPITGVNDFSVTADKQIAFVTNNKTVKLSMDKVEVLSHNNGGNQLVATSDSALIVRNGIQSIFKFDKNNQIAWSKTMASKLTSALNIYFSSDNGVFITGYRNYFNAYKNIGFIGKIAPDSKPCDYDIAIFHTASSSKVCKTDTLKLNLSNYPLTLGSAELLTTDFKIQWKRNKIAIPNATNITYIATESGSYEVTVSQGENCSVTSSPFTIDVLNASKPSITASINPVCEGVATTLTSTCSSDANVWSTGEKSSILTFTPKTTSTAITVYCAEKYSVGDSVKTCIGANSEPYIITSYSNNLGVKITGNTIVCGTKPTLLGTTITGGKSPYQYNWKQNLKTLSQSNQLSVSDGGTYSLSVLDQGGCTASSDIAILKSSPIVSLKGNTSFCSGTSMNLNAETTGGFPDYTFSWRKDKVAISNTNTLLNLTAGGNYAVTVTDSKGCQNADSLTITEKAKDLIARIIVGETSAFYPNSVVLKATTGVNFAYQWMKDNLPILNETYNSYTAKETGVFNLIVSKDGCSQASQPISIHISLLLASENTLEESSIHIGPNPTTTQLNIAVNLPEADNINLQVVDVKGQRILEQKSTQKLNTHDISLDTSQWVDGVYFLKIQSSKKQTIRKIIKQ